MTVGIVRANWSGTTGGPGLTQLAVFGGGGAPLSAANAQSAVDAVRAWFLGLASYLPNEVTIQVQPSVDQYNQATGQLTDTVTAGTAPAVVTGSSTGNYTGGAGFKVTWETNAIANGRRVRGRTYIVPAGGNVYDNDGTLLATVTTDIINKSNTLLSTLSGAGLGLVVWSRPTALGSTDGVITAVQTPVVKDKTAILRGRRD